MIVCGLEDDSSCQSLEQLLVSMYSTYNTRYSSGSRAGACQLCGLPTSGEEIFVAFETANPNRLQEAHKKQQTSLSRIDSGSVSQ